MINSYRDLKVWKNSRDLAVDCYKLTTAFPKAEQYGLASQLQRAAVSVPANIAEGRGRQHTKEFLQFLSIANGSLAELETHLILAERLGYADKEIMHSMLEKCAEIGRMLSGLKRSLQQRSIQK